MDNRKFDYIRSEVMVARKPFSPEDDIPKNSMKGLSNEVKKLLNEVTKIKPTFNFDDGGGFFEDLLDGDVQFYIVEIGDREFFIDTQGYNYARYVGELVD